MSKPLSREETEAVLRAIGCGPEAPTVSDWWHSKGDMADRWLRGPVIGEPGDHIYVGALREWFQRRGFWGYGHLGNLGWGAFFSSRSIAGPGAKVPNQYATEALAVVLAGRAGGVLP